MDNIEIFKDKKIYHVSHVDLDGMASRVLGEWFIKPITEKYFPLNTNYGDDLQRDFSFRIANNCDYVIFTDMIPNDLEFYNRIESKVLIFDHHDTSKEKLGDLDNYHYDLNRCGTKIFYDWLTEGKRKNIVINKFVELVDVYDLWKTKNDFWSQAKDLHNCMFGYVDWRRYDFESDTERLENFMHIQMKKFEKSQEFFFTKFEQDKIIRAIEKEKEQYKKAKKNLKIRVDNRGDSYAFTHFDSKISFVSHTIREELGDKIKYVVIYSDFLYKKKKKHSISLRSQGDFSVREIAEKHEGGGHLNSSGLTLLDEDFVEALFEGKKHLI